MKQKGNILLISLWVISIVYCLFAVEYNKYICLDLYFIDYQLFVLFLKNDHLIKFY